jgi:nicotinate-nucleotide pyrophosphorylase (carboxylating)
MTIPYPSDHLATFIEEDIGNGDITAAIIPESVNAEAEVVTREAMVLCGQAWFNAVFTKLASDVRIDWLVTEGTAVEANTMLCKLAGPARALLTGERTALNWLQTLSATATVARQYSDAVKGTGCKVLDTRKTLPGLRRAQKYAVACGGCHNHRMGLYDGILIKENHIMAAGSIGAAIRTARDISEVPVEVEVESLAQLTEAIAAQPDRIMLDNFNLEDLRAAVKMTGDSVELEASGNIDLDNIRAVAETGVDYISIGALTKHIKAIDLSMRIKLVNSND